MLISPDEVLTAAHMVWTAGIGVATDVQVSPGYNNGSAPYGTFDGVVTHYNAVNDAGGLISLADTANDFAVIHLSSPVPSSIGFMALGADFSEGTATVSGYPGYSGVQYDTTESLSTGSSNVLTGTSIGAGSSGGPVWIGGASSPMIVGLVSSGSTISNTGYFNKVTSSERATILSWVAADDGGSSPAGPVLGWIDTVSGKQGYTPMTTAVGGPSYLQWSYIWSSPDNVAMETSTPNVFLRGGPGSDALQVSSGNNVLDGGTGSNFLTGGTGHDSFFVDALGSAVVWNTVRNFHAGDNAALWGFVPGVSSYTWDTTLSGAAGWTGATLRANIVGGAGRPGNGGIDASITFTGLSLTQAKALQITTGTQAAGPYLLITNPGV